MTIQRMAYHHTGMQVNDAGTYVHYNSHKEVVGLIYDQLDLTQKQLERAQEQIKMLTEALCNKPQPPRGR